MTKDHFQKLLSGKSDYLESQMKEAILSSLGKAGDYMPVTPQPDYSPHDRDYFDRLCSTSIRSRYVNLGVFDFDQGGNPFISEATMQDIKDKVTAYSTPENIELLKAIEAGEKAINHLYKLLEQRGLNLTPLHDGLLSPNANYNGIEVSRMILNFGKP